MARLILLLVVTLVPLATKTAPSDNKDSKTLQTHTTQTENTENNSKQTRQKRWFNYFGYGLPPINDHIYSNYEDYKPSFESPEEPFEEIYRRLFEISTFLKQPNSSPQIPLSPFLVPVIYVPTKSECNCQVPDESKKKPNTTDKISNGTIPVIDNRVNDGTEPRDPNRNWGIVYDDPINDVDVSNRPVSFEPVPPPNDSVPRPPPPVEHGSQQAGGAPNLNDPPPPPPPPKEPQGGNIADNVPVVISNVPPSACDGAILTCCHQTVITYDCFVDEGCPDLSQYGNKNPCERESMLSVIDRFKKFCGQNNV